MRSSCPPRWRRFSKHQSLSSSFHQFAHVCHARRYRSVTLTPIPPIWLTEAEVASLLSLDDAIGVLERGLALEAEGAAISMVKTHVSWGAGHTLHAIGATVPGEQLAGTKSWVHTPAGAMPLALLFDGNSGALCAVIEAFALGQLRTGAISGVATRWLAQPEADELAIIGTGKQALAQVAAVDAVRPLRHVRVFSPTPEHREGFAAELRARFAWSVSVTT
jgi:alanine dehydrogenase